MTLFTRFLKDESGATAIEYGLIAALISVMIIGALSTIGENLNTAFTTIGSKLTEAVGGGGTEEPPAEPPAGG